MAEGEVVSLEAYAMVHAGLEAGVTLERAVSNASMERSDWDAAQAHWGPRLEGEGADRAQLSAFERALRIAREKYAPTWEPVASDVHAWVPFRRHFLAADDPVEFLRSRGLDVMAYARLEGRWTDRADEDEAIARALREVAAGPLSPCPEVHAVPSPLCEETEAPALSVAPPALVPAEVPREPERPVEKPSYMLVEETASETPITQDAPHASGELATPFRASPPPPPPPPPSPPPHPPIAIERYAVMFADRQLFGMSDADLATKHGLSAFDLSQATSYWAERVAQDPRVAAHVQQLVDRYRAAMEKVRRGGGSGSFPAVPAPSEPAPSPPRAKRDSGSTQPTEDLVRAVKAALPFARAKLPMPAHIYANVVASSPSKPPPPEGRVSTGTMFAPDGIGGAALPFDTRPIEGISMEAYARIAAELTFKPEEREEIFARYSIRDVEQYCVVANGWNKRVSELGLSGRYMQLFASHLDTLVKG